METIPRGAVPRHDRRRASGGRCRGAGVDSIRKMSSAERVAALSGSYGRGAVFLAPGLYDFRRGVNNVRLIAVGGDREGKRVMECG